MESEVKFGIKKIEYPRLVIATGANLIVLETKACEGFVINPGNTIFKIGEYITNYYKNDWCVFEGEVTLSN